MVTAFVVPIVAAAIPYTCCASTPAAMPTTTPTAALLATPIDASTHTVHVPSRLWPDAAWILVIVAAPTLATTADSAASTRLDTIPAASIVGPIVAFAAPMHCAALHQGQRHSRNVLSAACAEPPP